MYEINRDRAVALTEKSLIAFLLDYNCVISAHIWRFEKIDYQISYTIKKNNGQFVLRVIYTHEKSGLIQISYYDEFKREYVNLSWREYDALMQLEYYLFIYKHLERK